MAKIDETYHGLLDLINRKGFKYEDPNRTGVLRHQIPHFLLMHDFTDGFPAITTKKLYWKGIVGELLWILRGDTNIKWLNDNNIHIWDKDADNWGQDDLGRIYGAQLRNWTEPSVTTRMLDQFDWLIDVLKKNPMATKKTVTFWNPAEKDECALTPCHWAFEILVEPTTREEKITEPGIYHKFRLKWHQHSTDVFLGLPFNIASYALLAHIIGKLSNMKPIGIIGDLSNVHIYEPHQSAVDEQLGRSPYYHNSKCELLINEDIDWSSTNVVHGLKIKDFNLSQHTECGAIKAEMIPYTK